MNLRKIYGVNPITNHEGNGNIIFTKYGEMFFRVKNGDDRWEKYKSIGELGFTGSQLIPKNSENTYIPSLWTFFGVVPTSVQPSQVRPKPWETPGY